MPVFSNSSEELQQMMGRIPGWIIRWGLWVLAIIFIGVVIGCYYIKYPQTISGVIELTAYNPPVELLANRSGRVAQLFVSEGAQVLSGDNILVLESSADYNDILSVDSLLGTKYEWNEFVCTDAVYLEYRLGDIQSPFLQFQKECAALREYLISSLNIHRAKIINEQIIKQEELLTYQRQQLKLNEQDFELAKKNFVRDSVTFSINGIALADYERSRQILLQKEASLISLRSSIGSAESSLLSMRGNLIENQIQNESQIKTYIIELDRQYRQLETQFESWRREYLLTSPIKGKVYFSNVWSKNQNVSASERVATIIPHENAVIMGRMAVSFSGYSKIASDQVVNIRLENYPYMEFGMIRGKVRSISPIPEQDGYIVEICFPEKLVTSYGIPVSYVYKMKGTADIVTKDMRLIEQFIQPLKAVLERL